MKANIILTVGLLWTMIGFAQTADQNPNHQKAYEKYKAVIDSAKVSPNASILNQGTTIHDTYEFLDYFQKKERRKELKRERKYEIKKLRAQRNNNAFYNPYNNNGYYWNSYRRDRYYWNGLYSVGSAYLLYHLLR